MATKKECIDQIKKAFQLANDNGFTIVAASDPEGNSWNVLDHVISPTMITTGFIAISVLVQADANEIFMEIKTSDCCGAEMVEDVRIGDPDPDNLVQIYTCTNCGKECVEQEEKAV